MAFLKVGYNNPGEMVSILGSINDRFLPKGSMKYEFTEPGEIETKWTFEKQAADYGKHELNEYGEPYDTSAANLDRIVYDIVVSYRRGDIGDGKYMFMWQGDQLKYSKLPVLGECRLQLNGEKLHLQFTPRDHKIIERMALEFVEDCGHLFSSRNVLLQRVQSRLAAEVDFNCPMTVWKNSWYNSDLVATGFRLDENTYAIQRESLSDAHCQKFLILRKEGDDWRYAFGPSGIFAACGCQRSNVQLKNLSRISPNELDLVELESLDIFLTQMSQTIPWKVGLV